MFLSIGLPRKAKDTHVLDLWKEHGLGGNPSTLQIYPVAVKLLRHPDHSQKIDGMSIFLGRKIDPEDPICHLLIEPPERVFSKIRELFEFRCEMAEIYRLNCEAGFSKN